MAVYKDLEREYHVMILHLIIVLVSILFESLQKISTIMYMKKEFI